MLWYFAVILASSFQPLTIILRGFRSQLTFTENTFCRLHFNTSLLLSPLLFSPPLEIKQPVTSSVRTSINTTTHKARGKVAGRPRAKRSQSLQTHSTGALVIEALSWLTREWSLMGLLEKWLSTTLLVRHDFQTFKSVLLCATSSSMMRCYFLMELHRISYSLPQFTSRINNANS